MDNFVLTWAGECSAWECDDLGHLNMRHYVKKFGQARAGLMIRLGLTHAYRPGTTSTVRVRDFLIKYQGEARPGDALKVESAVIKLQEETAQLCHIMYHADGRIAATALETIEHVYLMTHRVFAWPRRVKLAADDFTADLPDAATPRNIDLTKTHTGRPLSELKAGGACELGAGVFEAAETDISEHVTAGSVFGRVTSGIIWYREGWPELYDQGYRDANLSAALLEARLVFHRYPKQGQAFSYVPVMIGADNYIRRFVHNLLDPVTGDSWATMEACGCKFDLSKRRLIKMSDDEVTTLLKSTKPTLTP